MDISVGTFNLNNLFSRYNFRAEIEAILEEDTELASIDSFIFTEPLAFVLRKFDGRLMQPKPVSERQMIAERIKAMKVDVLAVQEVENIDTLRYFNKSDLAGMYAHQVLIEGNDRRFIDVGLLSNYPIGAISSWQKAVHPEEPRGFVFGRDLLQVEIMNPRRTRRLFTLFINHLKSHFVRWNDDQEEARKRNDARRKRQAETIARIIEARLRPDSPYIVLGDMNDPPDSPALAPLVKAPQLGLVNALLSPEESNPPKEERPPSITPAFSQWTYRFKASGQPATHQLYDQIWLSPSLANKQTGAWINRRKKSVRGDGSDHDPAWIELAL